MKNKIKDWFISFLYGNCKVCGKPLGDKMDNRILDYCWEHENYVRWLMIEVKVRKLVQDIVQEETLPYFRNIIRTELNLQECNCKKSLNTELNTGKNETAESTA